MIASLCPKSYQKYLTLPIIGSILSEFIAWSHDRGFRTASIQTQIKHVRVIDAYFQQSGVQRLEDLTHKAFETAWYDHRHLHPQTAGTIRQIEYFLRENGRLEPPPAQQKTAIDTELDLFSGYLRCVRGLEPSTIRSHRRYLHEFLTTIGYLDNAGALATITIRAIEGFIQSCATRMNRYSLGHVIGYLRAFLRFQYEKSVLRQPLHTMIDTPRIYRLERLPRHLPWETVKEFLSSINTTNPHGLASQRFQRACRKSDSQRRPGRAEGPGGISPAKRLLGTEGLSRTPIRGKPARSSICSELPILATAMVQHHGGSCLYAP
jgi:hypothetical protein